MQDDALANEQPFAWGSGGVCCRRGCVVCWGAVAVHAVDGVRVRRWGVCHAVPWPARKGCVQAEAAAVANEQKQKMQRGRARPCHACQLVQGVRTAFGARWRVRAGVASALCARQAMARGIYTRGIAL